MAKTHSFAVIGPVTLGLDPPARANAPSLLQKQKAAEKIGLHVEPIEATHMSGPPALRVAITSEVQT